MGVNMTKIMLVEDDKSLREIYGVRLLAEGYEIISAGDGEEALAMAVKEKPGLILSDVMMPKISGFDMLDILRSTPETKDIKVIMMTALSSEDQRARGEKLGANRYLVKSQVGIEDVVRTVHEILGDIPVASTLNSNKFGTPIQTAAINNQPDVNPNTPIDTNTNAPDNSETVIPSMVDTNPPEAVDTTDNMATTPEPFVPTIEEAEQTKPDENEMPTSIPVPMPAPTPSVETDEIAPDSTTPTPEPVEGQNLPEPTEPFTPTESPTSEDENNTPTPADDKEPETEDIEPVPDMSKILDEELRDGSDTDPKKQD
jgi:CheY-like chemotaxis protein